MCTLTGPPPGCAPSQHADSVGRPGPEAWALGNAGAGYACGGGGELLAELFPAGRVEPGDAAALLAAARKVIAGKLGPAQVGDPFTLKAMCQSTLAVYGELVR